MASYPVCYLSHGPSLVCYLGHGLFPLCYLGHGFSFISFQLTASSLSAVVRPIHLCVSGWMLKFSLQVFASFPFSYLDNGFFSFPLVTVSQPLPSLQPGSRPLAEVMLNPSLCHLVLRPLLSLSVTGSWPLQCFSHGFFILSAVCYLGCSLFILSATWLWPLHPVCSLLPGLWPLHPVCSLLPGL